MRVEQIAVIDLGTNTFHLLIVEVNSIDNFVVREKFKETVRLAEGGITANFLTEDAINRGLEALARFKKIIDHRGITTVLANATSAIRSAQNGNEFVQRAKTTVGIDVKVINGNEEAVLIYLGVKNGLSLPTHEDVLLVDIGGGSVEFVVANRYYMKLIRSLNIGAARMWELIRPSDPITDLQIQAADHIYRTEAASLIAELKTFKLKTLIGSSGSFETLGAILAHEQGDKYALDNINGYRMEVQKVQKLIDQLQTANRQQRLAMPGMDPIRVDLIVMGSILIKRLIAELDLQEIVVSAFALKEGILFDYLEKSADRPLDSSERNVREKSVRALLKKFESPLEHAQQVSKLALQIFDGTRQLHHYGQDEREILHYSALLHDIGHFINRSGHHKHGQYIIQNAGLTGFSSNELLLISNIVRYHRKSLPSLEHFHYNILYKEHKEIVNRLAGILRIADSHRGRRNLVSQVKVNLGIRQIQLHIYAPERPELELEAAKAATELFEQAFNTKVEFTWSKL